MSRTIHGVAPLRGNNSYPSKMGFYSRGCDIRRKSGVVDKEGFLLNGRIGQAIVSRDLKGRYA